MGLTVFKNVAFSAQNDLVTVHLPKALSKSSTYALFVAVFKIQRLIARYTSAWTIHLY
jgi:hypothetical protein